MLTCGVGFSRDAVDGAGEAVRAALRSARGEADAIVVYVCGHADPRMAVASARESAGRARVVGCAAAGVLCQAGEIEDGPGVVAVALGGTRVAPFLDGEVEIEAEHGLTLAFLDAGGDPAPFGRHGFALTGLVGTPYRWLDGEIAAVGAAGVHVATESEVVVAVTRGVKPIGRTHVVTRARGKVIETLDGESAFSAFCEPARPLLPDLQRAAQTILVAVGEGEHEHEHGDVGGDGAVRGLIAIDPDRGWLALSEAVPEGTRMRFAVRDARVAHHDLRRMLARVARALDGRTPRLGFYHASAGRGRALFGVDGHDVALIQGALGPFPLAGALGGAEIGGTRLHLFSGVLALII